MSIYTQLTQEQRYQIYALLKMEHTDTEIAEAIGVHPSTIGREIKRNHGQRGYRPKQAHYKAMSRRRKDRERISPDVWVLVEYLVRRDWSPEQISCRLKVEGGIRVSHEWIYQYIWADKRTGGDLYRHLRCQKKRRKRYGSYDRRGKLPNRVSIDERPAVINERKRLGDWEVDTLIGRGRQHALVTLTERKSRLALIGKVEQRTAQAVLEIIVTLLRQRKVDSLTSDNGKVFAQHERIAEQLGLAYYFAPCGNAAWERGSNENMNGLLRQYFPKTRDFTTIRDDEIELVMHRINSRPRKCLDFRTPFEVYTEPFVALKT